ncbi:MAG TPA: CBS domain-containing protein [Steroidobacteraceae bacterium]|nr:CBS domain-containing protein [Steroidobacteraceae bacterium]
MSAELATVALLNERFLTDYPFEAARALEALPTESTVSILRSRSAKARLRTWQALAPDRAADVLIALDAQTAQQLLLESDPQVSVAALSQVDASRREGLLAALPEEAAADLRHVMQYPPGTAGYLMDPRIGAIDARLTVAEAIERLRSLRTRGLRDLFVVDQQMQLVGQLEIEDLALTGRERPLREITRAVTAVVRDNDTAAVVAKRWSETPLTVLPVVNAAGRFVGVVRQSPNARSSRGLLRRLFG